MTLAHRSAALVLLCLCATPVVAQVHYHKNGRPWTSRTRRGPDAETGGWYYNLGITGMRAVLVEDKPTALLIKYVFKDSPAAGKIQVGDHIVGANGKKFTVPHRNGYNVKVFGGHGPMMDFGLALDASQDRKLKGKLKLDVVRDGDESIQVTLDVGRKYGSYGKTFPILPNLSPEPCEFPLSNVFYLPRT